MKSRTLMQRRQSWPPSRVPLDLCLEDAVVDGRPVYMHNRLGTLHLGKDCDDGSEDKLACGLCSVARTTRVTDKNDASKFCLRCFSGHC